jgi:hypothetical protein
MTLKRVSKAAPNLDSVEDNDSLSYESFLSAKKILRYVRVSSPSRNCWCQNWRLGSEATTPGANRIVIIQAPPTLSFDGREKLPPINNGIFTVLGTCPSSSLCSSIQGYITLFPLLHGSVSFPRVCHPTGTDIMQTGRFRPSAYTAYQCLFIELQALGNTREMPFRHLHRRIATRRVRRRLQREAIRATSATLAEQDRETHIVYCYNSRGCGRHGRSGYFEELGGKMQSGSAEGGRCEYGYPCSMIRGPTANTHY